jgi:hypothetical protein
MLGIDEGKPTFAGERMLSGRRSSMKNTLKTYPASIGCVATRIRLRCFFLLKAGCEKGRLVVNHDGASKQRLEKLPSCRYALY